MVNSKHISIILNGQVVFKQDFFKEKKTKKENIFLVVDIIWVLFYVVQLDLLYYHGTIYEIQNCQTHFSFINKCKKDTASVIEE